MTVRTAAAIAPRPAASGVAGARNSSSSPWVQLAKEEPTGVDLCRTISLLQ